MKNENPSEQFPRILAKNETVKSRIFTVETMALQFANGVEVEYERLISSKNGAVLLVPVLDDKMVLIREYAAGVERYELGFPKGKIDAGEGWEQAAIRESQEEIGYFPQRVELLDSLTLAAGYMTHHTHIVLAEELTPQTAEGDEPEPLEVVYWPLEDWQSLLGHPEFSEGRAYAALMLLLNYKGII
ncbi:MAG: ADP compounds hydrolase NudE [Thiotrichales bacterium]|nr:ADP compounds hydrolase NudE [Thiotrichales bacterium]